MTLQEIKDAVNSGKTVFVGSRGYVVVKDELDQWLVKCAYNDYCIGLTHADGVTMNEKPEKFFLEEPIKATPRQLAREFSAILRQWISPTDMAAVVEANKTPKYQGVCATHDYCDPNQAMLDAITKLGLEWYGSDDPLDPLIDDAWKIAKQADFDPEKIVDWRFLIKDHSGRGIAETLSEVDIRESCDLNYKNDPEDENKDSFGDWMLFAEVGDEFYNEEQHVSFTRVD